jgi:hypothetical protein
VTRTTLALIAGAIAALGCHGCGGTPDVHSPVEGVVVSVDASGLTDVRGFALRTSSGYSFEFKLGILENATEFSPSHLKEHQATSQPVRVYFRVENGRRVVYRLEDVVPSPTPSSSAGASS